MTDLLAPISLTRGNSIITDSKTVQKFVFTGGPCGGKTTSLERVRAFLGQYGFFENFRFFRNFPKNPR